MWGTLASIAIPALLGAAARGGGRRDDDRRASPPPTSDPMAQAILLMASGLLPSHMRSALPGMAPAAPPSIDDLLAGYDRRGGSGGGGVRGALGMAAQGASLGSVIPGVGTVAGGLGGFALGGLRNLFGRRAASAPMDLSVRDAADAITRAYQTYLGRTPSSEEVWGRIRGTGWEPGDRWVGESGLRYHLQDIASSEEARRRRGY